MRSNFDSNPQVAGFKSGSVDAVLFFAKYLKK